MSLFAELKRRNVFRVAAAYLVFGWLVLQVADIMFPALSLPGWSITLVAALLVIGAVPALIISWVYELTPEGLKPESKIDPSRSITRQTGRRLDLITIAMVVLAAGLLLADRFVLNQRVDAPPPAAVDLATQDTAVPVAAIDDSTPVVAVLPFKATGSDDGGFLASGLHDDLLTRLAKLNAFRVISRTSMMEYAGTGKNMRQIGEELGAGYILEGGVQAMGHRVRINAQLIDARVDEHIWADTYDRELTAADLFDVQAELAMSIAGQLEITLSDSERALMDVVPTRNTEAYHAYLRGLERDLSGRFSERNEQAAVAAFGEAVRLDPEFAVAWAQLSMARTRLAQISDDAEIRESALAALAKARALHPDLLETDLAWVVYLYRGMFEYEQALEALEALGQNGSLDADSLRLKGWLYRRVGRFRDAYTTMLEAQRLDPRDISIAYTLVSMAFMIDDCEAADRHARAALSLAPDSVDVRTTLAEYELECTGNAQRANDLLRNLAFESNWHFGTAREAAICARDYHRILELSEVGWPNPGPVYTIYDQLIRSYALRYLGREEQALAALDAAAESLVGLEREGIHDRDAALANAWYYSRRGDAESTRRWVEVSRKRARLETKGDRYIESNQHLYYATSLAAAGLNEEAITELRVMFEEPGGHGFRFVDAWPDFDSLRDDPGYVELRTRFGDAR
jgi:TolB-like protein/cytochrome c-type biogenesis protein CcmH/NrfG